MSASPNILNANPGSGEALNSPAPQHWFGVVYASRETGLVGMRGFNFPGEVLGGGGFMA